MRRLGRIPSSAGTSIAIGILTLLGKVLPMQVTGDEDNPVRHIVKIERVVVDPKERVPKP